MRITLLPIPYHVNATKPRWRWRISLWGIVWREQCDCDTEQECAVVRQYRKWIAEGGTTEELLELNEGLNDAAAECECSRRPPHTHTRIGRLGSRPILR